MDRGRGRRVPPLSNEGWNARRDRLHRFSLGPGGILPSLKGCEEVSPDRETEMKYVLVLAVAFLGTSASLLADDQHPALDRCFGTVQKNAAELELFRVQTERDARRHEQEIARIDEEIQSVDLSDDRAIARLRQKIDDAKWRNEEELARARVNAERKRDQVRRQVSCALEAGATLEQINRRFAEIEETAR